MSFKIILIHCPNGDATLTNQFLKDFNIKEEQILDILCLNDICRIVYIYNERSKG